MQPATLSRAGPSSGNPQRVPRKSSSFLSLRKEKDKSSTPADPYRAIPESSPGPSRSKQTYFDIYPRATSNPSPRQVRPKARETRTSPVSLDTTQREDSVKKWKEQGPIGGASPTEPAYAFPSTDSDVDIAGSSSPPPDTPKPYTRTRSCTGPSSTSKWVDTTSVPSLYFSGSSAKTNLESSPQTPVDNYSFTGSYEDFPVVVAAPTSGVEFMDALVEGMNGGGDAMSGRMSSRSKFGIHGHHPLYQPPLPIPPPGVVLGGGKSRRKEKEVISSDSEEEDLTPTALSMMRSRRKLSRRPSSTRTASNSTITIPSSPSRRPSIDDFAPTTNPGLALNTRAPTKTSPQIKPKSVAPSISDIIRTHAPPEGQVRSRPPSTRASSMYTQSHPGHGPANDEPEPEMEPLTADEEAEMMSRSSIDSIADEVRRTLRNQSAWKPPAAPLQRAHSFAHRNSTISDNASTYSPRSETGGGSSIYSASNGSQPPLSPLDSPIFTALSRTTPSQAVATYLRSARLTTLLKLTRSPHASQDNPLTVSLSDLGSPTGHPLVVFLGLGCVRHIMGLYDEMAECLGLRLITIDRWGLGRTERRSKASKGIVQWTSVVEEVLDLLHIGQCSVMAHSAGAPYALAFASRLPHRVRGDICLLAPWVGGGESGGYRWLKYVPNGILKTAQAAEWKVQAWMIGKPPTIAYEGIGYSPKPAPSTLKASSERGTSPRQSNVNMGAVYPSYGGEGAPRPSIASSIFSEYDDLRDFNGRFESRSTLGVGGRPSTHRPHPECEQPTQVAKRKPSRGFLGRLKDVTSTLPQSPTDEKPTPGRRLKALRSMSSLRGKSSKSSGSKKSEPASPQLPPPSAFDNGFGMDELRWSNTETASVTTGSFSTPEKSSRDSYGAYPRANGRRSISFSSPSLTISSLPASPTASAPVSPLTISGPGSAYQATLGNALIAASHAESAKGTHNDLLQILNHENHSWGFSYSMYPHKVQVWYGDKDEKIAENAVRWMEHNMGQDRCFVNVVKGADHALMYKSSVVVEVLELVKGFWDGSS